MPQLGSECCTSNILGRAAVVGTAPQRPRRAPPSALRIASVKVRTGAGHAILVVKTTAGDYVLDNLDNIVRTWSQTGYRIVAISTADPRIWI